jgi:outer membrane protein TolC
MHRVCQYRAALLKRHLAVLLALLLTAGSDATPPSFNASDAGSPFHQLIGGLPAVANDAPNETAGRNGLGQPEIHLRPSPSENDHSTGAADDANVRPIDLPTVLQLAEARSPVVAFTREQVRQSYARLERANTLWLPAIRGGVGFNRHEGAIQDVAGPQVDASRGAFYTGLGASTYGNGSPVVPGVWANFQLADAIFQPLAAQQVVGARRAAVGAALNDALLRAGLAYLEVLRAHEELAISQETLDHAEKLADVSSTYAKAGQGLQSDADRATAELSVRRNNVLQSQESIAVASARLAELLDLKPTIQFQPIEPVVAPLDLVPDQTCVDASIAQALVARPELVEAQCLVCEAIARWKRERLAPLIPSVVLGVSDGAMNAGPSTDFAPGENRFDMDAMAYWELRNFGFGDQAAEHEAHSAVEQSRLRQLELMDVVAREVTESSAQVRCRRGQIGIAEEGIKVAGQSYQLNSERIEQAQGLPIEALQSLQALDQARHEYLRSVIDYDAAQLSLVRALGWTDHRPAAGDANER